MAIESRSLTPILPGAIAFTLIAGVVGAALTSLAVAAPGGAGLRWDPYVARVAGFSLFQALLSVLCSIAPGILVARAFARRPQFPGRTALLNLFGLPLVLPVIVAIFGIASVLGSNGALATLARVLGLGGWSFPYGIPGILIAHAFFNMPLAVRLLLPAIESIPGETWRLATQRGMNSRQIFRWIEWPALRRVLPGAAGLVFLLCFTSFAVILVFGGGPAATTLEVAIFHAIRTEFDIPRAVILALLQVGICTLVVMTGHRFYLPTRVIRGEGSRTRRRDGEAFSARLLDTLVIVFAALFVLAPLVATALRALGGPLLQVLALPAFREALGRSLLVGCSAGLFALLLGWPIAVAAQQLRLRLRLNRIASAVENATALNLVVSPIVLGAGLFVLLLPTGLVFQNGLVLAAIVNSVVIVPFVLRTLSPALGRIGEHHDRPCRALGIRGWNRLRLIDWPLLRPDIGRALALAVGLAIGDLTAIALFGTESSATLTLLLHRLMASYRMPEAAVVAALLTLLCLASFFLIERAVGGRARA